MYQQIKKGALALSLSLCCVGAFAQKTITGNVKDATGEPLIGVTIQAGKGGTVTDIDGNFSLQNLKPGDKITISYLGCKTQTITVGNQSTDKSLDEVVVIGYGTMKRRDLTGAVASVTGDKLAQNPVSNIAEALQGQLPGVSVTSQDGRPGGSMSIRVRGGGSITQSNDPLFIVDGVQVSRIDDIPADNGCCLNSHLWCTWCQWCHHDHHQERQGRQGTGEVQHVLLCQGETYYLRYRKRLRLCVAQLELRHILW